MSPSTPSEPTSAAADFATSAPVNADAAAALSWLEANGWLQRDLWIDDRWAAAASGARFTVSNPATLEPIAQVADAGAEDIERAIAVAVRAQLGWSALPAPARADALYRWFALIRVARLPLAQLLTLEQGKPLAEALGEVDYGARYVEWFAGEASRIEGDLIAAKAAHLRVSVIKKAVGVVAAITPWNFPNAMLARKLAPALAAGCSVLVKPAAETPLSALALAALAQQAGIPAGVISVLPTQQAAAFGAAVCADARISKITFTGSTPVGKQLAAAGAATLKRLSLELGGNAPFIVFADADLTLAVRGALASKFRNAGQTCVCANRFYIERSIYPQFLAALTEKVAQLRLGDGMGEVDMGPLVSAKALNKVRKLVSDAQAQGARIAYAGQVPAQLKGHFMAPVILADVPHDAAILREEIFGPVVTLVPFDTQEQALALANQSPFGLACYVYTQDRRRLARLPLLLETGMLGLNTGLISNEMAPFGGVKESGYGREGSRYGLDDYLALVSVTESFE